MIPTRYKPHDLVNPRLKILNKLLKCYQKQDITYIQCNGDIPVVLVVDERVSRMDVFL